MADFNQIIASVGASVEPLMGLMSGFSYMIGITLIWEAMRKGKTIADARARSGPGGQVFVPVAYAAGGMAFIYLPSMIQVAQNTFFGVSSPLAYASYIDEIKAKYGDIVYTLLRLINLGGLIWFTRGIQLLVHASEPGVQHGPKGLLFILAGIFALNVEYTEQLVSSLMGTIAQLGS